MFIDFAGKSALFSVRKKILFNIYLFLESIFRIVFNIQSADTLENDFEIFKRH